MIKIKPVIIVIINNVNGPNLLRHCHSLKFIYICLEEAYWKHKDGKSLKKHAGQIANWNRFLRKA
jgi:hypothetical protein